MRLEPLTPRLADGALRDPDGVGVVAVAVIALRNRDVSFVGARLGRRGLGRPQSLFVACGIRIDLVQLGPDFGLGELARLETDTQRILRVAGIVQPECKVGHQRVVVSDQFGLGNQTQPQNVQHGNFAKDFAGRQHAEREFQQIAPIFGLAIEVGHGFERFDFGRHVLRFVLAHQLDLIGAALGNFCRRLRRCNCLRCRRQCVRAIVLVVIGDGHDFSHGLVDRPGLQRHFAELDHLGIVCRIVRQFERNA